MAAKTKFGGTSDTGSLAGMVWYSQYPEAADVKWFDVLIGMAEFYDRACPRVVRNLIFV